MYGKIGDVQVAQGDVAGALESFRNGSPSRSGWPNPTPATRTGNAICRRRIASSLGR